MGCTGKTVGWGVLAALCLAGCQTPSSSGPGRRQQAASPQPPASPQQIEEALDRAQADYLDGRWWEVVVQATRVIEGAASPEEYYMAVKLLGLASCNRCDARPVAFAWKRLQPMDRASLRNQCDQHGVSISDDGVVTMKGGKTCD